MELFRAYARTLADEIIHELGLSSVLGPYLALAILKQVFANATDTTLIFVLYSVLKNRLKHLGTPDKSYSRMQLSYMATWLLIFLFGLADEGLFFYAQSYVGLSDIDPAKVVYWVNWYKNIHLSYVSVYCAIVLEIFYRSVALYHEAKRKRNPSRVSQSPLRLLLQN